MQAIIGIMAAIIISALLAVFVIEKASHARDGVRVNEAISEIQGISQGLEELYSNSNDYSKVNQKTAIELKAVPQSDIIDGTTISTPWYSSDKSSVITITPGTDPVNYTILLSAIPSADCAKVGSAFLKQDTNTTVSANGVASTDAGTLLDNCSKTNPATLTIGF